MSRASPIAAYQKTPLFQETLSKVTRNVLHLLKVVKPEECVYPFADFHEEARQILQDDTLGQVNFIWPRRHAKTTVCGRAFPLWHVFCEDAYYGRERTPKFVVLGSRTRDIAADNLDWIKDVLTRSEGFRHHFGDWGEATAQEWTKYRIVLKDGTCILCKGMGQQFVGLNYRGLRPTLILLDDLEDETNTATDHQLDQNFKWLVKSVEPSVAAGGRIVVIGTPKHRRCIVERLGQEGSGYASIRKSAIREENTPRERSLWAEAHPLEKLKADRAKARAKGELGSWVQEWMCKVTGESGDFTNIRYWDGRLRRDGQGHAYLSVEALGDAASGGDPELMRRLPEPTVVPVNCFLGADPAIGKTRRSDPTVVHVRGFAPGRRHFMVWAYEKRGAPVKEQALMIVAAGLAFRCLHCAVETTAYQDAVRQRAQELLRERPPALKRAILKILRATSGYQGSTLPGWIDWYLPGLESKNNPRRKKKGDNSRLETMQPDFALGRVYLRPADTAFRDELLDYPNGEDHHMDAHYYARVKSYEPVHRLPAGEGAKKRRPRRRRPNKGAWKRWAPNKYRQPATPPVR